MILHWIYKKKGKKIEHNAKKCKKKKIQSSASVSYIVLKCNLAKYFQKLQKFCIFHTILN